MAKDTNYYLDTYQKVVSQGDLQVAYIEIMNYFTKLHNSPFMMHFYMTAI